MSEIPIEHIQGDVLDRLPKDTEYFLFFHIKDTEKFRVALNDLLDPEAGCGHASAKDVCDVRQKFLAWDKSHGRMPHSFFNIAFSKDGLEALGFKHRDLNDEHFNNGQFEDAEELGDPIVEKNGKQLPDWENEFVELELAHKIHGIILVAGKEENVKQHSEEIKRALEESTLFVYHLEAATLPDDRRKNEHFGWRDGISQPFVEGYTEGEPQKGQTRIPPGVIIIGAKGDPQPSRPEWALGGSFMVFRKLKQLVPEFHKFLMETTTKGGILTPEEQKAAAKLLGSRLIGRWPSGTPLEQHPAEDVPVPDDKLNSFTYEKSKEPRCPYGAHIRKTNPRNNIPDKFTIKSSIMRAGIPYGKEVEPGSQEEKEHKTSNDRGLAFVAYQSVIKEGFVEQQKAWANEPKFPPHDSAELPGFDGIIGQRRGSNRERQGILGVKLPKDFVQPRAGSYFFVPSIPALHKFFSKA
ncbi:hypothetical protein B0J17DRAFT_703013 [Rhizoctonia solani]|nr:hypothetical protein B0J17DRAFT_703013 [Rhizoctonia solani]